MVKFALWTLNKFGLNITRQGTNYEVWWLLAFFIKKKKN